MKTVPDPLKRPNLGLPDPSLDARNANSKTLYSATCVVLGALLLQAALMQPSNTTNTIYGPWYMTNYVALISCLNPAPRSFMPPAPASPFGNQLILCSRTNWTFCIKNQERKCTPALHPCHCVAQQSDLWISLCHVLETLPFARSPSG